MGKVCCGRGVQLSFPIDHHRKGASRTKNHCVWGGSFPGWESINSLGQLRFGTSRWMSLTCNAQDRKQKRRQVAESADLRSPSRASAETMLCSNCGNGEVQHGKEINFPCGILFWLVDCERLGSCDQKKYWMFFSAEFTIVLCFCQLQETSSFMKHEEREKENTAPSFPFLEHALTSTCLESFISHILFCCLAVWIIREKALL